MSRQLKARKPDPKATVTKPKVIIFGPPNVGKTWVALDFPHSYYIDTEGGANLPHYQTKLKNSGGMYFGKEEGSQDFRVVIEEIQALATTKHDYMTLVIDSFSKLYNLAAAVAESRVGNDFGKDRKEANKPTRQLMLWLERLDMNVLLICHSKEKWARATNSSGKSELVSEGQTFDGFEKMEYDLHLSLQIAKDGAHVRKSRLEGFPRDAVFPWSFADFEKRAGQSVMLRQPAALQLADHEDIIEVRRLLSVIHMEEGWEDRVFSKAGVTCWEEMEEAKIKACIASLAAKVMNGQKEPAMTE